jgi:capsular exopolysaccharide synthesis family protein
MQMTRDTPDPSPAGTPSPLVAAQAAHQPAADTGFSEAILTIRKRKYIVLAAMLLGFVYGWYTSSTQPRLYRSTGAIEIQTGSSNEFRVGSTGGGGDSSTTLTTQVYILKSDSLLLAVARDLDLANSRPFFGAKGPMPHRSVDDPRMRQSVIAMLSGDITVVSLPKTDIIHITCSTLDANLSAQIVNKLISEYIQRSFQSRFDATQRASNFLSLQLRDLKQEVEDAQERLIDLGKRIGNIGLGVDSTHNEIAANLDDLSRALAQAQMRRILAGTRYQLMKGTDPSMLDPSIDSAAGGAGGGASLINTLRSQLENIRAQYAALTVSLGPNHPQVKELRAQMDSVQQSLTSEQNRLLDQAKEDYVAAQANEAETRAALDAEKAQAYKLRDDLVDYSLRQREYEASRTLYDTLSQRLRTAGIEAGLESTEIDIIDNATPPVGPTLTPRSSTLVVDTLAMLLLGVVEGLDVGIQTLSELETITGLPSLALIPRARRVADSSSLTVAERNLAVLSGPRTQFAEAFRALRTSLLLSTAGAEPQMILVTSAGPSEGKTTAATNLACVLAQRGVRVLLMDADLRRPSIHHRFGLNGKLGLTSVISGAVPLANAIQKLDEVPNLDILVSGPVPPFPTEMLGSDVMHNLLKELRGIYTHIVMDSPPLLSVTDSVVLAREADAVVMIVRHGKSNKHAVRRGRDILVRAGARITGIALNAVDLNSPEYYAYYGYTGYSGYSAGGVESDAWDAKSKAAPPPSSDDTSRRNGGPQ